jgi:hypothetical protein
VNAPRQSEAPRRRISRFTPPKTHAGPVSNPATVRKAPSTAGHDKQPVAKGFGLDLTHDADDHHDADFVKY